MRKLDTAELGPISEGTGRRVLRIREIVMGSSVGRPATASPADFDEVEWGGVRFRKVPE